MIYDCYNIRFNTANQLLEMNTGNETWIPVPSGSGSPAGADTQVQFNDDGEFGASAELAWDGSSLSATNVETAQLNGDDDLGVSATSINISSSTDNIAISATSDVAIESGVSEDVVLTAGDGGSSIIVNGHSSNVQVFVDESNHAFSFETNGSFTLGALSSDPADPGEGAIWYNSTSHTWKGYNGTDVGTFTFTPD